MPLTVLRRRRARSYLKALLDFEPAARHCLSRLGYELVGEGAGWRNLADYRAFRRRLPISLDVQPDDPYNTPFRIQMNHITSRIGFSHAPDGWHPFVETLREYAADPTLCYEHSTLARLYARYQPQNTHEVLLDHIDTPLQPFCEWPPVVNLFRWIWAHNRHSVQRVLLESKSGGVDRAWTHFGPHSVEYGRREFARIISVYESIKADGYNVEKHGGSPINGYFLVRGGQYRFVRLQGNHRVAALRALGHREVQVRIRCSHPPMIDHADLDYWTMNGGGLYPAEAIAMVFEMLFTESGREKARRNGLLD